MFLFPYFPPHAACMTLGFKRLSSEELKIWGQWLFWFSVTLVFPFHPFFESFYFEIISELQKSCNDSRNTENIEVHVPFTLMHQLLTFCYIYFIYSPTYLSMMYFLRSIWEWVAYILPFYSFVFECISKEQGYSFTHLSAITTVRIFILMWYFNISP